MNRNTLFNKIDKIFLLSPSFYTIISGALIGAAINFLTSLIFMKKSLIGQKALILSIFFLLLSSGLFVYISLILEGLRNKAKDIDFLLGMICNRQKKLWISTFAGLACIIISLIFLHYTITY